MTVKGTINSDKTGGNNGGDKTFSYPGYGDVTLKVNPKHEVNASKSPAISTSDPSKWEFVIRVNSVGTNQNVQLNDTMGELMKLDRTASISTPTRIASNRMRGHGTPRQRQAIPGSAPRLSPWRTVKRCMCATP